MAINKKLINFDMTYDQLKSHANGLNKQTEVNSTTKAVGNILTTSIVFLNDGIWTHNKFIPGFKQSFLSNYVTLSGEDQTISGNKHFSSNVIIDSLQAGDLIVKGSTRFIQTILGNIQTADKVNSNLTIQLNGGTSEDTNKFTFNGSKTKIINITSSSIGAQPSGNYMTTNHPANGITSANITNWNSIYNWYSTDIEDANTKIDKWKEVEAFLNGISDTSTLNGILGQYTKKEADIILQPIHTNIQSVWSGQFTSTEIPDAKWILSGESGLLKNLGIGSYLIQIIHSTDSDGGIYTGYFSYTTGSGTDEEIILHRSGNNTTQRLYAKIKYINNTTCLLLAAKEVESDCTELTIKMKKLL